MLLFCTVYLVVVVWLFDLVCWLGCDCIVLLWFSMFGYCLGWWFGGLLWVWFLGGFVGGLWGLVWVVVGCYVC